MSFARSEMATALPQSLKVDLRHLKVVLKLIVVLKITFIPWNCI